jgi:hypothetical protein
MLRLIGLAISIGLADALNPSTIAPALYLASSDHPRRNVTEFTLAVFGVFLLGGAIILLGPGQAVLAIVPRPSATVRQIAEVVAGGVILAAAGVLWRRRARLARRQLPVPRSERRSSAVLGATISIVGSGYDLPRQVILLALYNGCFVLPLLLIMGTLAVAPDRSEEILGRARRFLQRYWPQVLAGLALLAGVFVTLLGATGLASGGHGTVGNLSRGFQDLVHHR